MAGSWNQAVALFKKNLIYQRRHLRSNLRLVLFPAVLFLLLGVLRYNMRKTDRPNLNKAVQATEATPLLSIPASYIKSCVGINVTCPATVLVTGNNRTFGEGVAGNMFSNFSYSSAAQAYGAFGLKDGLNTYYYHFQSQCIRNSTVPIAVSDEGTKVRDSECIQGLHQWRDNYQEINNELFDGHFNGNPNEILAAYDLQDSSSKNFHVNLWYNTTPKVGYAYQNEDNMLPDPGFIASSMSMVSYAYLQSLLGDAAKMAFEFVGEMPHPQTLSRSSDAASSLGFIFFPWVILQLFPVVLTSVVYEKQQKLTIMMKMHGLGDAPYWLITYLYFLIICTLFVLCFIGFGYLAGLVFFTLNSCAIQFIFYFIHINLLISSAFLLSKIFSNVKTASVVGFILVFGSWILGFALFRSLIEKTSFPRSALIVLELFPPLSLYRGMYDLAQYSTEADKMGAFGMQWRSLRDTNSGMREVLILMTIEWLVFLLMTYCSFNCMSARSILSFFKRSHKSASSSEKLESQIPESRILVQLDKRDIDEEMEKVEQLVSEPNLHYPIVSSNLRKTFPAQDGNPEKHAVRGLNLAVGRGECFGLLGPNGAGKTSFISMLTGLSKPTSGSAYIEGLDLATQMNLIYSSMGVCPQHDLLWDTLTGREHLNFYGRLKDLTGSDLSHAVEDSLSKVNLLQEGAADKLVKKYSGGMKRRLSLAISLIGDPKVVYLDEPSTGLDPASRNMLWDAVTKAKQNRAIILTTHSMEEAEHICDRIGIIVDGSLQCLGSPDELKDRFGGTYMFTVATLPQDEKNVEDMVRSLSPNAKRTYQISGTQKFEIPKADVRLSDVFMAVKYARERFVVKAWDIAETTLEDVFIKVATE